MDKRVVRARTLPTRFSNLAVRADRRRLAELARGRAARLAKAGIPLDRVMDNPPQPWLRLTPTQSFVEGKGNLGFWDPSFVGLNVDLELAAFDAAFKRQSPTHFGIVRPSLSLAIKPAAAQSVVELSVMANVDGVDKPTFEIDVDSDHLTWTVANGTPDMIVLVVNNWVELRLALAGATKDDTLGKGGNWAFYDLKVTPLP